MRRNVLMIVHYFCILESFLNYVTLKSGVVTAESLALEINHISHKLK